MMDEKNLEVETNENTPAGVVCENGVCRIDFSQFDENEKEAKIEENEENMSMQDLMDKYDRQIRAGEIIKGKIIQIDDKEAIVGLIGAGNDGKLTKDEAGFDNIEKLTDKYKVGDEIEAKVIRRPMESDSFYILSMKEMFRQESRNEVMSKLGSEELLKVIVKEVVKGGLVALYKGQRVFIPSSQIELRPVRNLEQYVGKELEVNIIEAEERRGSLRAVGSRKLHLEKAHKEQAEKTWTDLEEGKVVTGKVARLTDFGAFINVNGVDGLLHISEMAYGKTPKPSSILKIGEDIEVKVIGADKENGKLSLSLKALKEDPWKNIAEKYPNEAIVLGKVVRFTDFGAFVELEPGVDGLVHISQISHNRIEKPSDVLKIREEIKVMILDSDEAAKKISLSVKSVE